MVEKKDLGPKKVSVKGLLALDDKQLFEEARKAGMFVAKTLGVMSSTIDMLDLTTSRQPQKKEGPYESWLKGHPEFADPRVQEKMNLASERAMGELLSDPFGDDQFDDF